MAKKEREKRKSGKRARAEDTEASEFPISIEALRGVFAVLAVAIALFLALAAFQVGGAAGLFIYTNLTMLLGVGYMLLPFSILLLSIALMRSFEKRFGAIEIVSVVIFLISALGMVALAFPERGGIIGAAIAKPLVAAVDTSATVIFLMAFLVASLILAFDIHLSVLVRSIRENFHARRDAFAGEGEEPEIAVRGLDENGTDEDMEEPIEEDGEPEIPEPQALKVQIADMNSESNGAGFPIIAASASVYTPPPLSLLGKNKGKPEVGDVKANMNIIRRTLQNFGIQVEMD